jgi:hypothetical protein
MLATFVADDFQVTLDVRSFELWSLYVPVALNCCCEPAAMVWLPGVTVIDFRETAAADGILAMLLRLPLPQPTKVKVNRVARNHN